MVKNNLSMLILVIVLAGILLFAFAPGQWTPACIVNHDKFVHAVVFFGLSVLLSLTFPRLKLSQHFVGLMFFAVLIEWVQYAWVDRGFSVQDIVFDLVGVVVFYTVVYSVKLLNYSKLI
ncbi:MAG: VanZ family protein [Proteobacteria bacterium]|nr:VanZ family protein [Pseudomonadota bacterium]